MTLARTAVCALWVCGCAEADVARVPDSVAEDIAISEHDPGPACCPLETVEVRSGKHEGPSLEALRLYAWRRAVNYVVLDTFSILDDGEEGTVLLRARLYRCPQLARLQ
jgi:hypothetical protein